MNSLSGGNAATGLINNAAPCRNLLIGCKQCAPLGQPRRPREQGSNTSRPVAHMIRSNALWMTCPSAPLHIVAFCLQGFCFFLRPAVTFCSFPITYSSDLPLKQQAPTCGSGATSGSKPLSKSLGNGNKMLTYWVTIFVFETALFCCSSILISIEWRKVRTNKSSPGDVNILWTCLLSQNTAK